MINDELEEIVAWLRGNKLWLNISKTHFMLFSNKQVVHPNIEIELDGQPITCVSKITFSYVILDTILSWNEHILYVCHKVVKGIGMVSKLQKYLNKGTLRELYYSLLYPYLTYCNHVWGLAWKTYMNTLVRLQKRAVRMIPCIHPRKHTDPLFTALKLPKCNEINKFFYWPPYVSDTYWG